MSFSYGILGPLEVRRDGALVDLGSGRQRALLAMLVLHAGEVVSADRIIDDLWGESPPDSAANAVQGYISKLRRALGRDVVLTHRPGYLLALEDSTFDAARFEQLTAQGSAAMTARRFEDAATLLREALALWRGPALADFAYEQFAAREAARLEQLRVSANADRVDAELALGRHASLIGELEVLVEAHPLDERLSGQLMLAMYRAGRQADALRTFSRLRSRLADELGLDPGPDVRQLELAILEQQPDLAWSRPAYVGPIGDGGMAAGTVVLAVERPVDLASADAPARWREPLRELVANRAASVVRAGPAGVVATFRDPLDAVECAADAIRATAGDPPRARASIATGGRAAGSNLTDAIAVCLGQLRRADEGHVLLDPASAAAVESRLPPDVTLVDGDRLVQLVAHGVRQDAVPPVAPAELPPALAQVAAKPFVGRRRAVDLIADTWKQALDGTPRALLLSGEPGIGRTRMAAEGSRFAVADGEVLFGRCDEGMGIPYQPFVEALTGFVSKHPGLELAERLGRYPEELARLVPDLERLLDLRPRMQSDADTERYRLFTAVEDWLATASLAAPVVLVLDDLHWATRPTLLLLRYLLRFNARARMLVVGTYRDTELSRDHALAQILPELSRQPGVERLPVRGLDEAEVLQLIEVIGGDRVNELGELPALAAAIHTETDGNPFFVVEVLRSFLETRDNADERPAGGLVVPQGIREVLGRRLSQLSPVTNEMLACAAVIGAEFDVALLGDVTDADPLALEDALAEAAAARLIEERTGQPGTYRFAHTLVRDTLYRELRSARRIRLHRAVGEALEARAEDADDVLPELAHHFGESIGVVDVTKAVKFAAAAGDRALHQLAPDEAASYFGRALELLDLVDTPNDGTERVELLIRLGVAERLSGDASHRETLLRVSALAERGGHDDQLVRAALANSRGLWSVSGAIDEEKVRVLERALKTPQAADDAVNARLRATLAAELVFDADNQRRWDLSLEAVAAARRAGDTQLLAEVLSVHATTMWAPGHLEARRAAGDEALAIASALGDPELLARILVWARAVPAFEAMDLTALDQSLEAATALGDDLHHPTVRWATAVFRSSRELLAGRVSEAEELAFAGLELGQEAGQPDAFVIFAGQLWFLRYEQGRADEILDTVQSVIEQVPGLPAWHTMLGVSYCETGRAEAAREVFESVAQNDFDDLPADATGLLALAAASIMCAYLRDRARVQRLLARLEPLRDCLLTVATGSLGATPHFMGMLHTVTGQWADAEACFVDAAATHERIGAASFLARTHVEHARMLIARNGGEDPAVARRLIDGASVAAARLGLGSVARQADELSGVLTSRA